MKERIFSNWHAIRFVYLAIGLGISGYSIIYSGWTGLLPGMYFASMAVFHFGCATGGCYIPTSKARPELSGIAETEFEEIKTN